LDALGPNNILEHVLGASTEKDLATAYSNIERMEASSFVPAALAWMAGTWIPENHRIAGSIPSLGTP
jgi:hypothetical protein